jgi:hypothetical protein
MIDPESGIDKWWYKPDGTPMSDEETVAEAERVNCLNAPDTAAEPGTDAVKLEISTPMPITIARVGSLSIKMEYSTHSAIFQAKTDEDLMYQIGRYIWWSLADKAYGQSHD